MKQSRNVPCRLCTQPTVPFLDLGSVPLPEEFRTPTRRNSPVKTYPLGLSYCRTCLHVQLTIPVDADPIYKQNYFYDYSVTADGSKHWQKLAGEIIRKFRLTKSDLVVDVGSNTGSLLQRFREAGIRIYGVDPATKLTKIAVSNGIPTVNDYMGIRVAEKLVRKTGQASIITCTNVFDHVSDLSETVKAVDILLRPDGAFIIEVPYFYRLLTSISHIIYHQQIDYMMVTPMVPFFHAHGMDIVDAREVPMHGGSLRLTIRRKGLQKPNANVAQLIAKEKRLYSKYTQALRSFSKAVYAQRDALKKCVVQLGRTHKRIAAVGASAKGITLLNYAGIGGKHISYVTEKSPLKTGKYTPSGIPVVPDAKLLSDQPDYAILLAWNFGTEVRKNLRKYTGRWIIPVPTLQHLPKK